MNPARGDGSPQARQAMLDEYERLTGFRESNFNAVHHHRVAMYGPPCPRCGKVLRTPIAYKCFECGYVVHEPNWSFLFTVTDVAEAKGRGTMLVTRPQNIEGKLRVAI
ncbi:MAG TPA: hypothetical protein VK797_10610 [Tepidisphaeraceae bacterium]|jgi:hypothetical protein|nr:hypothetical protein [Tepidisphaeraceae bacterium]